MGCFPKILNDYKLPILAVIWIGIFIYVIIYGVFFYRDWKGYYEHRLHTRIPDSNYYEKLCTNNTVVMELGITEECHEKKHMLNQDPYEYAIYDALSTRGICLGYKCTEIFESESFTPVKVFYFMICITIIILALVAIYLVSKYLERFSLQILPTTTSIGKKIE